MGVYQFKAKDSSQRVVSGRIKASSKADVEKRLMSRQLVLISAHEQDQQLFKMTFNKVKGKNLAVATRQLAFLVNASVPIVQALDTVAINTIDRNLNNIFKQVSMDVETGQSFSDALQKHPQAFNSLYINMVKSGEEGGSLDTVLKQLASYIEKSEAIKNKVKSAMIYPVFVAVASFVIITGIIVFLVPKFEEIFESAGKELPALTQFIVSLSHLLRDNAALFIVGMVFLIFGFLAFIKTKAGAKLWEQFLMGLPGFGNLLSQNYIANYSRTLSSLLSSGVLITDAIHIGGRASGSLLIEESSTRIGQRISVGHSFGKALRGESLFPSLVRNMIIVGEETGNVDDILGKIADFYEEQVANAVDGLIKVIEPLLILIVAAAIGFILVALYLPIFQISGTLAG